MSLIASLSTSCVPAAHVRLLCSWTGSTQSTEEEIQIEVLKPMNQAPFILRPGFLVILQTCGEGRGLDERYTNMLVITH